jgi:hypothetical protein
MLIRAIGIDTGKNTLHMVGLDEKGAIVLREKVSRSKIDARLGNVPPCLIGIEAGMATHYMSRELVALGHKVKQVPPTYSKPFRQGHKNDFRDAQAVRWLKFSSVTRYWRTGAAAILVDAIEAGGCQQKVRATINDCGTANETMLGQQPPLLRMQA